MSLTLARNVGESIIIGNNEITITILNVRGNQVKISIAAPPHISVHREEIYDRIQNKKESDNRSSNKDESN